MDIPALIRSKKYRHGNEHDLHRGIEECLREAGVNFHSELVLSPTDRVDVMTEDGTAIEVKVAGSKTEVLRQLHRYAEHEEVRRIVLVTTRSRHRAMPRSLRGKSVVVVWLRAV